jgi:hypothetical protein
MCLPRQKISPLRHWMAWCIGKSWITFWASLIQIHYLYGSESFYLLLNFENYDSGLAVKCYSASGLIPPAD